MALAAREAGGYDFSLIDADVSIYDAYYPASASDLIGVDANASGLFYAWQHQ